MSPADTPFATDIFRIAFFHFASHTPFRLHTPPATPLPRRALPHAAAATFRCFHARCRRHMVAHHFAIIVTFQSTLFRWLSPLRQNISALPARHYQMFSICSARFCHAASIAAGATPFSADARYAGCRCRHDADSFSCLVIFPTRH